MTVGDATASRMARRGVRGRDGFTLIELLVVVVIIGIVSSIVLLSLGLLGDDRALRQEARRMASLIELAADEAVLQGRDFGLEIMESGYRFVEHDPVEDQWYELLGDELLRQRSLPESTYFELFIEDRRVQLDAAAAELAGTAPGDDEQDGDGDRSGDYAPHGLILSSGEVSPMRLEILREADDRSIGVEITAAGEIEVTDDEDRRQ